MDDEPVMPLLMTQAQAAQYLGASVPTVRRWQRAGVLPTFTDPDTGRVLYPRPALDRWLASHAGETA